MSSKCFITLFNTTVQTERSGSKPRHLSRCLRPSHPLLLRWKVASYFPSQKCVFQHRPIGITRSGYVLRWRFWVCPFSFARRVGGTDLGALSCKIAPHLDNVVGNHAQPYPSSHAVQAGIEATT